jgi:hypothetical protein
MNNVKGISGAAGKYGSKRKIHDAKGADHVQRPGEDPAFSTLSACVSVSWGIILI